MYKWKPFYILLFTLSSVIMCNAQVITTDPKFPTENSSVTVYFHADQGNQGLMDYDGDIYAHTGLITNLSESSSDWKYVIADWNENTDKAKLTKVSSQQ